jgi:hypothetical protein
MNLHLGLKRIFFSLVVIVISSSALAETTPETEFDPNTLVEVHTLRNVLAPYKERRDKNGFSFALLYESFEPKNYVSPIDQQPYAAILDSPIPLAGFSLDYQRNIDIGSISIGLAADFGSQSGTISGTNTSISVTKYSAAAKYILNTIWDEPYVAPYVGIGMYKIDWKEDAGTTGSANLSTDYTMFYQAGLLLQLDWIDYDSSKQATRDWGIQNTYIDVFVSKYDAPSGSGDPDTSTDFTLGAAFRMEF